MLLESNKRTITKYVDDQGNERQVAERLTLEQIMTFESPELEQEFMAPEVYEEIALTDEMKSYVPKEICI